MIILENKKLTLLHKFVCKKIRILANFGFKRQVKGSMISPAVENILSLGVDVPEKNMRRL